MLSSSEKYLVSICIPVYCVERFIERCARSLFGQTYSNIEYIFVNDCSIDNSIDILERVTSEYDDRNIKILHHEHNRGLAAARNTAVSAASGEFIMHVDSDDWLELDAVEVLVKEQLEADADIVSGNAIAHYSDRIEEIVEPEYISKDEMIHQTIKLTLDHVIWRRLIRRSLYTDNNIQAVEGLDIGEDHYTLPRLAYYAKSIARTGQVVYHYNCMNDNSYMQVKSGPRHLRTYRSNIKSIDVLSDFFEDKDSKYVDELGAIKMTYAYKSLWSVLKEGNRPFFDEVCNDIRTVMEYSSAVKCDDAHLRYIENHYLACRLKVISRILIKKVFGIIDYRI